MTSLEAGSGAGEARVGRATAEPGRGREWAEPEEAPEPGTMGGAAEELSMDQVGEEEAGEQAEVEVVEARDKPREVLSQGTQTIYTKAFASKSLPAVKSFDVPKYFSDIPVFIISEVQL